MFAQVLVPLDGTPEAATAVPLASALMRAVGGVLTLARIVPAWAAVEADGFAAAATDLDGIAGALRRDGVAVRTTLRRVTQAAGIPPAIAAAATECGAELIVMATHARSGLARVARGSVAEGVVLHSTVPVLLVPPEGSHPAPPRAILAPVDGSPAGSRALDVVTELAAAFVAEVLVLRVVVPDVAGEEEVIYERSALADAQRQVDALAEQLRAAGVVAQGRAVFGGVPDAILEAADRIGAGLIVMSTHARSGMTRAVLGSVADAVVRQAHCPTVLVRRVESGTPGTLVGATGGRGAIGDEQPNR